MGISRRDLIRGAVGAGALLLTPAFTKLDSALLSPLGPTDEWGTSRSSKLFSGTKLVHADLHNHSLMSDGVGDPREAFASMRAHGLDVAALTDHATLSKHLPSSICAALFGSQEPTDSPRHDCQTVAGIDESSWAEAAVLADAEDRPDEFVAIRGFEWSSPTLGHVNVWFSQDWTDPLHTAGGGTGEGAGQFLHDEFRYDDHELPPELTDLINDVTSSHGVNAGMRLFYEWLTAEPGRPVHGGGADGLACFNHPGREVGRFGYFGYEPSVADRIVSMEIFNRTDDYLFEGTDSRVVSPLVQCLDAGWYVGLLGVTDEHGDDWGGHEDKGRGGLWVEELTRDGVREALAARRFFATNLDGLRLDAAASSRGRRVRMGQHLPHDRGPITFELDLDRGAEWSGKSLSVQVLTTGSHLPTIADTFDVTVPEPDAAPLHLTTNEVSHDDTSWVVLRVSDPEAAPDGRATGEYAALGKAIAYASPFYLVPSQE